MCGTGDANRVIGIMSSTQVIKAAQMFTKNGNSKNVSVVKEIVIGLSLGLVGGVAWKVIMHV